MTPYRSDQALDDAIPRRVRPTARLWHRIATFLFGATSFNVLGFLAGREKQNMDLFWYNPLNGVLLLILILPAVYTWRSYRLATRGHPAVLRFHDKGIEPTDESPIKWVELTYEGPLGETCTLRERSLPEKTWERAGPGLEVEAFFDPDRAERYLLAAEMAFLPVGYVPTSADVVRTEHDDE